MFRLPHLLPYTYGTKSPFGYKVQAPQVLRPLIFAQLTGQLSRCEKNRPGWLALILGFGWRPHPDRSNQGILFSTVDELNAPKKSIPCHHVFPSFSNASKSSAVWHSLSQWYPGIQHRSG